MLHRLIGLTLRQHVLIHLLFLGVLGYATLVALPRMPVERYPNISLGQVRIGVTMPGTLPQDVERQALVPLEDALRDLPSVGWVRCEATHGAGELLITIAPDHDPAEVERDLRLRVLTARESLPLIDGRPAEVWFEQVDVDSLLPVVCINLAARDATLDRLTLAVLAGEMKQRLLELPGVRRIDNWGEPRREFHLALDPARMAGHGVGLDAVVSAIRSGSMTAPGGMTASSQGERAVSAQRLWADQRSLSELVVGAGPGQAPVAIRDLLDAQATGLTEARAATVDLVNGLPAMVLRLVKTPEASALTLRRQAQVVVDGFIAAHRDLPLEVSWAQDATVRIATSMQVLTSQLMQALILVMGVLQLFLGRSGAWRRCVLVLMMAGALITVAVTASTVVAAGALIVFALAVMGGCRSAALVGLGIGFSYLGTLAMLHVFDQSLNEISMLGMVVVSGVMVDDSIVVLESIRRHREAGEDLRTAVINGVAEVAVPVLASALTTIAAFVPLLFMRGYLGDFLRLMPIAVITALAVSLVESLWFMPLHLLELESTFGPEATEVRRGPPWWQRRFHAWIDWHLAHPVTVLAGAAVLVAAAAGVICQTITAPGRQVKPWLQVRFFPEDSYQLQVRLRGDGTQGVEETSRQAAVLSQRLRDLGPQCIGTVSAVVGVDVDERKMVAYRGDAAFILLELPAAAVGAVGEVLERARAVLAGGERGWRAEVGLLDEGPPSGAEVAVRVHGPDDNAVREQAQALLGWLTAQSQPGGPLAGLTGIASEADRELVHLAVQPDALALARAGVSSEAFTAAVAAGVRGLWVGNLADSRSGRTLPVRLRLSGPAVSDPAILLSLPLVTGVDRLWRLGELGRLDGGCVPALLVRERQQRAVNITAHLAPGSVLDPLAVQARVATWAREHQRPGTRIDLAGEVDAIATGFASLASLLGIALFLIYMILAVQFQNYLQPLVILANVLFCLTGVVLVMSALAAGTSLFGAAVIDPRRSMVTVQGLLAVIGLAGLCVNDAIILIDGINRRRRAGDEPQMAICTACRQRLRPMAMTSLTTMVGLLPMAIGLPAFSAAWSPFATCFVSGLLVSQVMTLLVVPVILLLTGPRGDRRSPTKPPPEPAAAAYPAPRQPDPTAGLTFFIALPHGEEGPFRREQLLMLLREDEITLRTLIRRHDMAQPMRLGAFLKAVRRARQRKEP